MALSLQPVVPIGTKPTPASFGGPATVPGNWWQDAKVIIPLWEGGGQNFSELVLGTQSTTWLGTTAPSWEPTGVRITASDGEINFPTGTLYNFVGDQELTVALSFHATDFTAGTGLFGNYNGGGNNYWQLFIDSDDVRFHARGNAGDGYIQATWTNLYTETAHTDHDCTIIVRRLIGGEFECWVDGVSIGTDRDTNDTDYGNDTIVQGLTFGVTNASAVLATYHSANVWDRALTENEIQEWHADPYVAVRSYQYVGAPAAAGGNPYYIQYATSGPAARRGGWMTAAPAVATRIRRGLSLMGVGR